MIAPARRAAFEALRAIEDAGTTLPDALAKLRRSLPDARDVALATDIVIGTVRWRGTLDFMIAALASRPLEAMDPDVLRALRLSAHQLLHLDRVPPSAVVNDGVALAKGEGNAGAGGFVNAVLRRLADPTRRPSLPARPAPDASLPDWTAYLSVTWSHPEWLVERWVRALGPEGAEARLRYDQSAAPVTVRAVDGRGEVDEVRARLLHEQVETEPARYAPRALRVRRGNPLRTSAATDGTVVVQDEGSQLVAEFAHARDAKLVLDVCAAPGGKTAIMAAAGGGPPLVVAGDVRRRRVRLLRQAIAATGLPNARVVAHDASRGLPYAPVFDLVLVDAPCSGLGTLRRDPDVKWRRQERDFPRFVDLQRRILSEAARVVAEGGRLVYGTCSSEPEENDEVASWFRETHPDFAAALPPAAWREPPLRELIGPDGTLRTSPERHDLDVFFAAAFVRKRCP